MRARTSAPILAQSMAGGSAIPRSAKNSASHFGQARPSNASFQAVERREQRKGESLIPGFQTDRKSPIGRNLLNPGGDGFRGAVGVRCAQDPPAPAVIAQEIAAGLTHPLDRSERRRPRSAPSPDAGPAVVYPQKY